MNTKPIPPATESSESKDDTFTAETPQIIIDPMRLRDIPDILEVENLSFPTPWSKEAFLSELLDNDKAYYMVAKVDNRPVAYIGVWIVAGEGHITNIAVHPNYRRKGIGRRLMLAVEEIARNRFCDCIWLEVRESNETAKNLYSSLGYKMISIRRGYYRDNNEDAEVMRKQLCIKTVLGIESSCDETSAAVVNCGRKILSNVISSQILLHRRFGGVVPEIASRKHVEMIIPVIHEALEQAGLKPEGIDAIAVTCGPGLVGSLLVGVSAAKALALAFNKPLIGVNHIEGHIYANFLENEELTPPLVCLTVSGGHTELFYMPSMGKYRVLGRTRDDAAGEAIDKVGRLLGLSYPAGPELEKLAKGGDPSNYNLPKAYLEPDSFDFSFSGLKTAAVNLLHHMEQIGEKVNRSDFAASLQESIFEVLVHKAFKAVQQTGVKTLCLSGGVAANQRLRDLATAKGEQMGVRVYAPDIKLCTDNAAVIASAGFFRLQAGQISGLSLNVEPGLRLR
jgi:N6-L-threonylcarbamoyladenine synthase